MRIPQLKTIIAALENSKPTHDHYPEPVQRHQDALAAAKHLLGIAEHSVMPGIAEHALAGEIAAAVLADEQGEGCDLSAGLFGPQMTLLIRRIVDVYLSMQPQGRIVGYMDPEADFLLPRAEGCVLMGQVEVSLWRTPAGKYTKPLYEAPIDLQQFQPAVHGLEIAANFQTDPSTAARMRETAEHLRAVIDNEGTVNG